MFNIGDTVTWTSQAGGRQKVKTGEIVGIVPKKHRYGVISYVKGMSPSTARDVYNTGPIDSAAWYRDHESYLVAVKTGKTDAAKKTLYWPRVSWLKKADDCAAARS